MTIKWGSHFQAASFLISHFLFRKLGGQVKRQSASPRRKPSAAKNQVAPSREMLAWRITLWPLVAQIYSLEKDFHAKRKQKNGYENTAAAKRRCQISMSLHPISQVEMEMKLELWTIFFGFYNLDLEGLCFFRGKKKEKRSLINVCWMNDQCMFCWIVVKKIKTPRQLILSPCWSLTS